MHFRGSLHDEADERARRGHSVYRAGHLFGDAPNESQALGLAQIVSRRFGGESVSVRRDGHVIAQYMNGHRIR